MQPKTAQEVRNLHQTAHAGATANGYEVIDVGGAVVAVYELAADEFLEYLNTKYGPKNHHHLDEAGQREIDRFPSVQSANCDWDAIGRFVLINAYGADPAEVSTEHRVFESLSDINVFKDIDIYMCVKTKNTAATPSGPLSNEVINEQLATLWGLKDNHHVLHVDKTTIDACEGEVDAADFQSFINLFFVGYKFNECDVWILVRPKQ